MPPSEDEVEPVPGEWVVLLLRDNADEPLWDQYPDLVVAVSRREADKLALIVLDQSTHGAYRAVCVIPKRSFKPIASVQVSEPRERVVAVDPFGG